MNRNSKISEYENNNYKYVFLSKIQKSFSKSNFYDKILLLFIYYLSKKIPIFFFVCIIFIDLFFSI